MVEQSKIYLHSSFCKLLYCLHNGKGGNILNERQVLSCIGDSSEGSGSTVHFRDFCLFSTILLPVMLTLLNKENIKHPAGDSHVLPPLPGV